MTTSTTFAHVKDFDGTDYTFIDEMWTPEKPPKPYRTLATAQKFSPWDETLDEYQARRGKNI